MDTNILINNGVDINHGLELLGDMEMYNETLEDFLLEQETRILKIAECFHHRDMANYAVLVHAMKSDSKYLGFMVLADLSYQHEMASKENNVDFVSAGFPSLMEEADRITNVVKQYLGRM